MVPSTISTAARASVRSASPRVRLPGSISAQPMRNPAAPATTMQLSSSTPCAVTSSKKGVPLPALIASPATTPSSTPFCRSTYSVPTPSRMPPANARNVTPMLLVKISDAIADCSSTDSPRSSPGVRGCVTAWYLPGTRPLAGPGSRHAQ